MVADTTERCFGQNLKRLVTDALFREYDLGYVHIDVKHLPKLRTADARRLRVLLSKRLHSYAVRLRIAIRT